MKKRPNVLMMLLILVTIISACVPVNGSEPDAKSAPTGNLANDGISETGLHPDAKLEITGMGVELTLTADEMKLREQETVACTNLDSNGEVTAIEITGFSLGELLLEHDIELTAVASVTLVAEDGYTVTAPGSEFEGTDIYIMLERDGETLEYPRSAIPDKRAMYWVKELVKIDLSGENSDEASAASVVSRIVMFREAVSGSKAEKLDFNGAPAKGCSLRSFADANLIFEISDPVKIKALDGFEKLETKELFLSSYVTTEDETGIVEGLPRYWSETISYGMHVKGIDTAVTGKEAIYFGSEISVSGLFKAVGMGKAQFYEFVASDGFVTTIPYDAIEFGKIFLDDEEGFERASFEGFNFGEDVKGGGKVKYLVSVQAVGDVTEAY